MNRHVKIEKIAIVGVTELSYAEKVLESIDAHLLEEAERNLALSITQDSSEEKEQLAELLFSRGFIEEAKKVYQSLKEHTLYKEESTVRLAEIYLEEGNDLAALEELLQIPKASSYYVQALLVQADLYQTQGLYEVSEQKLKEAHGILPNEPIVLFALAELHFEMGQYYQAMKEYETLQEEGYSEFAGVDLLLRLGEMNSQMGNWREAVEFYQTSLEHEENPTVYFQLAVTYFQMKEYPLAIQNLNKLKELDPFYTSLYPLLMQAYEKSENMDSALAALEEGLTSDQTNRALFLIGAKLYRSNGEDEKAIPLLERALALQPDNEEARLELAKIMEHQEELEQAIEVLNQHEEESDPKIFWRKASVYEELEEYENARTLYEKAAPFLLKNEAFLKDYLLFLRDEGEWARAEELLQQAKQEGVLSEENQAFLEALIRKE